MTKSVSTLLLAVLIFWAPVAKTDPVHVDLSGRYAVSRADNVIKPEPEVPVTFIFEGKEYRPDGSIYQDGENIGGWGIHPGSVDMLHTYFELRDMAVRKNIHIYAHLETGVIEDGSGRMHDVGRVIDLRDPEFRSRVGRDIIVTPGQGQSFRRGDTLYHENGRVYEKSEWTGETWGVPLEAMKNGRGGGNGLDGIINADTGRAIGTGVEIITVFSNYVSAEREMRRIEKEKREYYDKQISAIQNLDSQLARGIEEHTRVLEKWRKDYLDSLPDHLRHYESRYRTPDWIKKLATPGLPYDLRKAHVRYDFTAADYKKIEDNLKRAVENRDTDRIVKYLDVIVNSDHSLPSSVSGLVQDGIFQPHLLDPNLPPSPLTGMNVSWSNHTHEGQLATRTANELQSQWFKLGGLEFSPTVEIIKFLSTVSVFRAGTELTGNDPMLAKTMFMLAQQMIDTPLGASVGAIEALWDTIKLADFLARGTKEHFAEALKDPSHLIRMYDSLVKSLPEIRQSIQKSLIESAKILLNGSPYEKGKIAGDLVLDAVVNYATGGAGIAASAARRGTKVTREALEAVDQLQKSTKRVRRDAEWIRHNREIADQFNDLSQRARKFEFYNPVEEGPLHRWPIDRSRSMQDLERDGRGVIKPGQLLSDTFSGGTYMSYELTQPMRLIRVHSREAGRIGQYWSYDIPFGPGQAQLDFALLPDWGNRADAWTMIEVPAGTRIFDGRAAPQFTQNLLPGPDFSAIEQIGKLGPGAETVLPGGAPQVVIDVDRIPESWIIEYGSF